MNFNIRGRLADGSTISGTLSGANAVEALAGFITGQSLKAEDVTEVKLVASTGNTAKVRPPRKKKESANGATAADKAAGANHVAAVARETRTEATRPSPRR